MDWLRDGLDILLRLDVHLNEWAASMGAWLYGLLFAIVFAETGLVVTPFLPGDSLLFAVGALAATEGSPIDVVLVGVLLTIAAILGDAVNYQVGKVLGPKVFSRTDSKLLNQQHLVRAQRFYEKYGGKTIVIARFVPIVRTFAPFVAGIGKMGYARFAMFNVVGALVWVWSFLLIGYWFGNRKFVKQNFTLVIGAIIVVSVLPAVFEMVRARRESARARAQEPPRE
jgi:membrane-associated protein